MKYIVVFEYIDGETFTIEIKPSDMKEFSASIGTGQIFFNDESGSGVWISIDKVRHFTVERVDEFGNRIREDKEKKIVDESKPYGIENDN